LQTQEPNSSKIEVEFLPTNSSPSLLGWFLGSLSALLFLSIFYVGDIISTGYFHILNYRDFAKAIETSDRPDLAIKSDLLTAFPSDQANTIRRVSNIFTLIHNGDSERAEQILLKEYVPEVPSKYRLAAVLSWITENSIKTASHKREKNLAEQRRKDFERAFSEVSRERLQTALDRSSDIFPHIIGFDKSIGDNIFGFFVPIEGEENLSVALVAFYQENIATRDEEGKLLKQSTARRSDLLRMAKEKTKTLMTRLALPQFDERTKGVYREASLHSSKVGVELPQLQSSDT